MSENCKCRIYLKILAVKKTLKAIFKTISSKILIKNGGDKKTK